MIYSAGTYFLPTHIAGNGLSSATDWGSIGFNETENDAYPTGGGYSLSGNGVEVILNQNSCISDVIFSSNRIYFKASGSKGNAKVTLTNNGVRVWTWHLWCTDEPATYIINGYSVMDRNMGAITRHGEGFGSFQEMTGFYYPYGYPIGFTAEEYANGVSDGNNPMKTVFALHPEKPYLTSNGYKMPFNAFYAQNSAGYQVEAVWARIWGNGGAKTCYDPCPPGYKVTPYDFWINFDPPYADYYGVYSGSGGTGVFFPYNGRAYKEGIQTLDIKLGTTNYSNISTRGYRVYMWTSSSTGDNGYYYHVRKAAGGEYNVPMADKGVSSDILTRGMGVRCVWEW